MKSFIILASFLAATCTATWHGAVSTQYAHLDPHGHTYSYGYADPNSQKHETRTHDGVTRGSYSYVDGSGHLQSVSYTADPHHGFHAVGTNLPKAPVAVAAYAGAPAVVAHYASGHAYPHAHIVLDHSGVPVDTPEVQHAKAAHAAAHAVAAAAAVHSGHHHLYKRSLWAGGHGHLAAAPVALTHAGVPVDTPDVQAAKAEHAAAHAKALSGAYHAGAGAGPYAGAGHAGGYAGGYAGAHGYHVPVLDHKGVPVDTPEVQHARAAHYAALAKAAAESGPSSHDDGSYSGHYDGGHGAYGVGAGAGAGAVAPSHYSTAAHHGGYGAYKGPLHYPVLHNGVPVEPAEVQHARAAHLSALAAESSKGASYGGHYDGPYGKW